MVHKTAVKWIVLSVIAIILSACGSDDKGNDSNTSSNAGKVVLHCPGNELTRDYSFPGPAITYTCCSSNDFPSEMQAISINKLPKNDQSQSKDSNLNSAKFFSSANSCVRMDSLSAVEKLKLLNIGACNTFVVHEHTPCSCTRGCDCGGGGSRDWVCNCPGVPTGQLPEIKPQDSLRSNPELVGVRPPRECSTVPPSL